MNRILVFLCIFIFFTTNSHSNSKFDKDLKKFSKDNGFIDNKGKVYPKNEVAEKKNTILIIYNHGSSNDQRTDECTNTDNNVPQVIRDLHNKEIKNFYIKI